MAGLTPEDAGSRDVITNGIDGNVLYELAENEEGNAKSRADLTVSITQKFIGRWVGGGGAFE